MLTVLLNKAVNKAQGSTRWNNATLNATKQQIKHKADNNKGIMEKTIIDTQSQEGTDAAILRAAETLFQQKGYERTTTTEIARQAGVTHAMLHYYFRTKEQIFHKVLGNYIRQMHEDFKSVMSQGEDAAATVRDVALNNFDFMEKHQGQINVLLDVARNQPQILEPYKDGFMIMMSSAVERHQKRADQAVGRGEIAKVNILELVGEIVMSNYATFTLLPLVKEMGGLDEAGVRAYLESRKRTLIETIDSKLAAGRK